MDEKELTTLLRSQDFKQSSRTWRCPDENQLAAYVNGQLPDRRKLERHLADCKHCLETTSFLLGQFDPDESVPAAVLARARRLGENVRPVKWNWGWAAAGASACLLIVTSIILWQSWSAKAPKPPASDLVAQRNESPLPTGKPPANDNSSRSVVSPHVVKPKVKETQTPIVRGTSTGPRLLLIFPREGSTLHAPIQPIRWLPIPDATFYEVKVVTLDGAAVAAPSTNETELLLPFDALTPGSTYYVTVVAHLSGNRTIRSEPVKFRVAETR
jgi:hypothetical protein